MNKIYCLFVFKPDPSKQKHFLHERCWGWSSSPKKLEDSIKQCTDGIFEMGYYDHALIEEYPEGICRTAQVLKTFQALYDPETQQYQVKEIAYLEWLEGTCNFSLG